MKKIFVVFCIFVLMVSMGACGKKAMTKEDMLSALEKQNLVLTLKDFNDNFENAKAKYIGNVVTGNFKVIDIVNDRVEIAHYLEFASLSPFKTNQALAVGWCSFPSKEIATLSKGDYIDIIGFCRTAEEYIGSSTDMIGKLDQVWIDPAYLKE